MLVSERLAKYLHKRYLLSNISVKFKHERSTSDMLLSMSYVWNMSLERGLHSYATAVGITGASDRIQNSGGSMRWGNLV